MEKERNIPSRKTIFDPQDIDVQAIDQSPLPMAALEGPVYIVRYVNPAFRRLVGKEDKDLINTPFADAVPEAASCLASLNSACLTGEAQTCVTEVRAVPGPLYWACTVWPVKGTPDSPEYIMLQVTDTTETELFHQKTTAINEELMLSAVRQHELAEVAEKLSNELRKSRDELEKRVEERTGELSEAYESLRHEIEEHKKTEEQLRQAHKLEAIGTLAGGIAHDFNNLLAGILGFTEMAIEDAEGQPQIEKSLANVLKSAKRGRDLVKQILAFSRKANYNRTPLSVTPILKETIKLLRASIPATVEISFSSTAKSDTVIASPVEVQQVVMNLATNAFMAMEEKGGKLEITLSEAFYPYVADGEALTGEFVQITVRDTGVGMTPEVLQKAFDPFFTTREPGKGTGMGLAVVYGIVRNLNGTITVLSAPGEGTTFGILIPKTTEKINDEQNTSKTVGGNETILFVEDEELINDWGKTILERLGYTVMAFRDPLEALRAFSRDAKSFDLVITDQSMPKMAGTELAGKIYSLREDIPMILCTGHAELMLPEKLKEIGITEVVLKPLTKHELATAVRRVLDVRKSLA